MTCSQRKLASTTVGFSRRSLAAKSNRHTPTRGFFAKCCVYHSAMVASRSIGNSPRCHARCAARSPATLTRLGGHPLDALPRTTRCPLRRTDSIARTRSSVVRPSLLADAPAVTYVGSVRMGKAKKKRDPPLAPAMAGAPAVLGRCIHCCTREATTRDYVPPRALLKSTTGQRVTVPSCDDCNGGSSRDDEYFRLTVSADIGTHSHPAADDAWETSFRGLQRPRTTNFKREFYETTRYMNVVDDQGAHLGRVLTYQASASRQGRVTARIIRGLYQSRVCDCRRRSPVLVSRDRTIPGVVARVLRRYALLGAGVSKTPRQ